MIAPDVQTRWLVRLTARWSWRSDARAAAKLRGFAATEHGSALDMFRAAELEPDATLRRQFMRHALDEARHARRFAAAAARREGRAGVRLDGYAARHADRQDLYERLGRLRFLAFVHAAERRGQAHFAALAAHFADDDELGPLFSEIERDERFHVAYSGRALARLGGARAARWRVGAETAWQSWRRAGRRLGDAAARALLTLLYVVVVPPFALLQRALDPARPGWTEREDDRLHLGSAHR